MSDSERLAQARRGAERLGRDPHDPVGRGLLGEAWAGLTPEQRPDWLVRARADLLVPDLPDLPIRTERLLLRLPVAEDAPDLYGLYRSEDVVRYLLFGVLDRAGAAERIARHADPRVTEEVLHLVLVMESQGRVVGELTLRVNGPAFSTAEIGWVVHPRATGRGLATEAARELLALCFEWFGVHRVIATLDARNDRSAALCERIGMRLETRARADFWSKGEWTDSLTYALLRTDRDQDERAPK